MGTITLTVEGSTVGTVAEGRGVVKRRTVSEADSSRIIQAYAYQFRHLWPDRQPTHDEVIDAWFSDVIQRAREQVQYIEQEQAAQAARAAVQPITVTEG